LVQGSTPWRPTTEVFTFQWGLFSRLGLTFRPCGAGGLVPGFSGALVPGSGVCPVSGRALAWLWRLSWLVVMGAGLLVVGVAVRAARRQAWRGSCGAACVFSGVARRPRGAGFVLAGRSMRPGCAGCGRRAAPW